MTTSLAWSPAYEIDHGVIDAQHRQLLELADLVRRAVEEHHGSEVLEVLARGFAALEREAVRHFATEEALLEKLGSPLLEEHRRLHAQIMREARAIHEELMHGPPGDWPNAVKIWMHDRLVTHIVRDDRAAFDAAGK